MTTLLNKWNTEFASEYNFASPSLVEASDFGLSFKDLLWERLDWLLHEANSDDRDNLLIDVADLAKNNGFADIADMADFYQMREETLTEDQSAWSVYEAS